MDPFYSFNLWKIPTHFPELHEHEIHLWWSDTTEFESLISEKLHWLSAAELERAQRFHFLKDRQLFLASRLILRKILGNYLSQNPASIEFEVNPFGKPFLRTVADEPPLYFNISHSKNVLVIAVSRSFDVGIDVEFIDESRSIQSIAQAHFASHEFSDFSAASLAEQVDLFFQYWTGKEALLKACGKGLSIELQSFALHWDSKNMVASVQSARHSELEQWTVVSFEAPEDGWRLAIAHDKNRGVVHRHAPDFLLLKAVHRIFEI